MKIVKYARLSGLCLAGLCAMVVFAFGSVGSASARPSLLFLPLLEKFPYHLVGKGGASKLETVGGFTIKSTETHVLALVLNSTLFDLHLEFLGSLNNLQQECSNTANPTTILVNLLGHLGLIDPGLEPGVLLLIPTGFTFACEGILEEVRGKVIGLITKPKVNELTTLLTIKFEQTAGRQRWTLFLLGEEQIKGAIQESSLAKKAFEQSGQEGEATLHALPKEGPFLIILDP